MQDLASWDPAIGAAKLGRRIKAAVEGDTIPDSCSRVSGLEEMITKRLRDRAAR